MPDHTDTQPTDDLHTALAEARRELDTLKAALDTAERRRAIERALLEADAIDLETASLLTETAIASAATPDIPATIADLRRRKPFLFARRAARPTAMAPSTPLPAPDPLAASRQAAATTGDRTALLRYLKLRRSA